MKSDPPIAIFSSAKDWHDYLLKNHTNQEGVRIRFVKKGNSEPCVSRKDSLEIALMFGWIDGKAETIDDKYWLLKYTPRRPKSMWSKINCVTAERLIREKKMQPSGLLQVELAKKDGRWDNAYDSPMNMTVPDDFLEQLSKNKKAFIFFETLNKTNKYHIAFQLQTAKKPETRMRRMESILDKLSKEEKFY